MEISKHKSREKPRNLWINHFDYSKYQVHVTISFTGSTANEKAVYMDNLEKRKEAHGICGECNEPGTGYRWCKPCNAKRFEENFKNWTSGNKDIDEFIQQSQLNAVYYTKYLEWIPFGNFQNVTYITKGDFGKIYSAKWPEGYIFYWDIENQNWDRVSDIKIALKSLDNSSCNISTDFLNEIKSHLQIYLLDIIQCYGITQDPNTKDYMMVLQYCDNGNLRNYLNKSENYTNYESKITDLYFITRGLLDIHNAEKVHKDFHSGNILFSYFPRISDLGMCQPANNEEKSKGTYGVLPYMAPEVLCGRQYTKASDIYSFGIIMNEFLSEEIPYNNIPHDYILAINVCKGLRPKISEDTPKLIADLIIKCWDAKAENRPTAKELCEVLKKWDKECGSGDGDDHDENSEIYSQIKECEKIRESKLKNSLNKNNSKSKSIQTHPQAIYTSRLLNFKNLPEPVNSSIQINLDSISSTSANPISECFDVQLSELDLNEEKDDDNAE